MASKHSKDVTYLHPVKVMNQLALELKNTHKCDLIIVLSHCGYSAGNPNNPGDEYLAQQSENVDIIIGGHSHTKLEDKMMFKNKLGKDVMVVQDGEKGEYVGRIDLWF